MAELEGPDTDLVRVSEQIRTMAADFRDRGVQPDVDRLDQLGREVRKRAVLVRPAAGRDLTAQDVREAICQTHEYERIAEHLTRIARPAVARTDGQPPAVRYLSSVCDTCEHTYNAHASTGACEMCSCQRFRDLPPLNRDRAPAPPLSPEWTAAPADDTAAPGGPTADEAVASAARIVEAWAHLRMDTPEDQATHDELVRVSRATIAAYVRTRPWSSAGQPVRGSQPEATDG